MKSTKLAHSSHFDYESVMSRIRNAKEKHRPSSPAKPHHPPGAWRRARAVAQPQRGPSLWSRIAAGLRDESKQLVAAGLVMLGFVVWFGCWAEGVFERRTEEARAVACQNNQLSHAAATYCFDDRRVVHTLKDDGSTTRPGLDWRVNESALRKAESSAVREAKGLAPSQF